MKVTRYRTESYEVDVPTTVDGFKGWEFSSGPTTGEDFKAFARLFRGYIKKHLPEGSELVKFSTGHYYISGFVKKAGKFAYFCTSDVRHFPEEWHENLLIRTATGEKDYHGGSNGATTLDKFKENVARLLA